MYRVRQTLGPSDNDKQLQDNLWMTTTHSNSGRSGLVSVLLAALVLSGCVAYLGAESGDPSGRVYDPTRTPVQKVPLGRHGPTLRPGAILGDSTWAQGEPGDTPYWHELAIASPWLFTATGQGMMIYNIANPDSPSPRPYVDGSNLIPWWGFSDKNFFLTSIATPDISDIVITGTEDFGLIIWDTSNKSSVDFHYGDSTAYVTGVYALTVDGIHYALALNGNSLVLYNASMATTYDRCENHCPGVNLGILASGSSASAAVSGVDTYVVYRNLSKITILDLVSIASGSARVTLSGSISGVTSIGEPALWKVNDDSYHMAVPVKANNRGQLWVYDVTCIVKAGTCSLPAPMVYPTYDDIAPLTTSVSIDGDNTYLYVGSTQIFGDCIPQREYLYEVSNPPALVELTPQTHSEGYWGWYYEDCYGYNSMSPRDGKVSNGVLYRGAFSFIDSHPVTPPNTSPQVEIFADGFESGDTRKWN